MNLNPLISGLGTGLLGFQQGRQQQEAATQAHDEAVKQMMFKLALEKAARDQTQANADRDFSLRSAEAGWVPGAPSGTVAPVDQSSSPPVSTVPGLGTGYFDPAKSKAGREFTLQQTMKDQQAEKDRNIAKSFIMRMTNPRTKRPYTEDEATALSMGGTAGMRDAVMGNIDPNSSEAIRGHVQEALALAGAVPQIVQGTNPDGSPAVFRVPKVAGPAVPVEGILPKSASGAGGSQAPISDMRDRYQEIEGHAKDLAAGKWNISPAMQMREGLTYGIARENAAGKAPLTKQLAATFMDKVGAGTGGDFARYQALMNSTRALGDDAAKIFKGRQNEEAVLREVALAQLTPDDYRNPTVVNQKLSRLRHIITLAEQTSPEQMVPQSGSAPSRLSPEDAAHAARDPAFAAWLKAHGH